MDAVCKQRGDAVEGGGAGGGYHKKQQDDNEAHTRATADETEPELPATYQSAQQPLKWQQHRERRGGSALLGGRGRGHLLVSISWLGKQANKPN